MTLDRHTLAERLRPHLSPTEPRLASELLVLAGVQTGSRVGGTVAAALQELRAAGHARPAGGTRQALRWLASAPGDLGSETLPLARLDATLTLTTTARTTAGGTRRTELAATVALGPSWPATTPTPPRWSTALNDAQVAGGALAGARTNAIARAEAQLRALRKDKTPLPLLPSKDREDFLAYLASVARGARQDSACAWLAKRGLARTTVEATAWLEEAVEAGVLAEHQSAASDGTVVLRYSPADPSVKPAPLPKSSAPEAPPPASAPERPHATETAPPAPAPSAPLEETPSPTPPPASETREATPLALAQEQIEQLIGGLSGRERVAVGRTLVALGRILEGAPEGTEGSEPTPAGLSPVLATVWRALSPTEAKMPKQLARESGITGNSISSALRYLESRGLAISPCYGWWKRTA